MARRAKQGDWARFFDAVHEDLLAEWLEEILQQPAIVRGLERIPPKTHRKVLTKVLQTFGRAMDAGFSASAHAQIERQLLRGGYLEAFSLTDIAVAFRIYLRLIHDQIDIYFSRRSAARRAEMWRELEDVMFANFARVAATRVQLETDALQESEARFRTMLDMAGDGIGLADADTRQILYANGQMGRLMAAPPEELLGLTIEDLVPPRLRDRVRERMIMALKRPIGEPWTVERKFLRRNGDTFDAALSAVRVQRPGHPARFLAVIRDVSADKARTQALRSHSRQMRRINAIGQALTATFDLEEILRLIITSIQEVVPCHAASLILARNGTLVFQEALGPRGSAVKHITMARGQGLAGWVVEHGETAVVKDAQKDARLDREIEVTVRFPVRDVLCVPLRVEDRVLGAIEMLNRKRGVFTTQDVELAEAFASFAAIALDKATLFEERAAMRTQLLQAEAAKHAGRLASTIAQEMIDPITILKNNIAICQDNPAAVSPALLGVLDEEVVRLQDIIRLLVDYSNSTAETVRPTPLDLIVADLAGTLRPTLEAAGVRLEIDQPGQLPRVAAVAPQVTVALGNLLRHAIHVSPAGQTVRVQLRQRDDTVEATVSDAGSPLTPQQIETLFDPAAVQRGILAKGLDLYIASAIVRHHGGELHGEGLPDTGTRFSFTLPVAEAEAEDEAWLSV